MTPLPTNNQQPMPSPNTPLSRDDPPTVSSVLLGEVQAMDPAAWSRLVETFGPIVYRWCRTSGVDPDDASDLVQDVFASVARGVADFQRQKPSGSFRGWLATITRNRVRDHFRRVARREAAAGGTDAMQQLQQHAESLDSSICAESAHAPLVRRVLESVRGEFQPATWDAFWLATIDGRPTEEVAQATGLAPASVYQAKSRVLRRLRQRFEELPD